MGERESLGTESAQGAPPWFTPRVLSLITTHRCTAACEHCCFACSPHQSQAIPLGRLHGLVDEAADLGCFRLVAFTGGECFLLGRDLEALIARCTRRGLASRCVSNGFWAATAEAATAWAARLRDAGLGELCLSTGPYHARFVPPARVRLAAEACAAAGIQVTVVIEAFLGSVGEDAWLPPPAGVRLVRGAWIAHGSVIGGEACGGRSVTGVAPAHGPDLLRFRPSGAVSPCASSLTTVAVTPSLDLVTCCGLTLEEIPALHVASLRRQGLAAALAQVRPDLLKMWIHAEGPEAVLDFVAAKDADFRLPLDSAHACHSCRFLHASDRALAVLARYREEVEDRVLVAYARASVGMELAGWMWEGA